MKLCTILGGDSDIAKGLMPLLTDYKVSTWARDQELPYVRWDLIIVAIGKVAPVGLWESQGNERWDECIRSNLLLPAKLLRRLWHLRNPDAKVCWLAGSNPNAIMPGYSAYNTSKMAVLKLVEQIDAESPDVTLFALGPGITDTKIHNATKEEAWPNPRLDRAMIDKSWTKIEDIYACLKWCIDQTKEVVGGRNICVSDGVDFLAVELANKPSLFKLRRDENKTLFKGIEA